MKTLCLFFIAATALAQTPALPKGITQGPSAEGITEYRLDNGLQVLLFPDPSKETITVNMTYLVGSKHENYGETGMAHLLEHMVFKGSPKHTDIPKSSLNMAPGPMAPHPTTAPTISKLSAPPTKI